MDVVSCVDIHGHGDPFHKVHGIERGTWPLKLYLFGNNTRIVTVCVSGTMSGVAFSVSNMLFIMFKYTINRKIAMKDSQNYSLLYSASHC